MIFGALRLAARPALWCAKRWPLLMFCAGFLASGWVCGKSAGMVLDVAKAPKQTQNRQDQGRVWEGSLLADGGARLELPKGAKASARLSGQTEEEEEYVIVVKVPRVRQAAQGQAEPREAPGAAELALAGACVAFMYGLFLRCLASGFRQRRADGKGLLASAFCAESMLAPLGCSGWAHARFEAAVGPGAAPAQSSWASKGFWSMASGACMGVELMSALVFSIGGVLFGVLVAADFLSDGPWLFRPWFEWASLGALAAAGVTAAVFWWMDRGFSAKGAASLALSAAAAAKAAAAAASDVLLRVGADKHAQAERGELAESVPGAAVEAGQSKAGGAGRSL